jgi:hypothetical protein
MPESMVESHAVSRLRSFQQARETIAKHKNCQWCQAGRSAFIVPDGSGPRAVCKTCATLEPWKGPAYHRTLASMAAKLGIAR